MYIKLRASTNIVREVQLEKVLSQILPVRTLLYLDKAIQYEAALSNVTLSVILCPHIVNK